MKLFTFLPKKTIIITEEQSKTIKSLQEGSYENFQANQAFRYKAIGRLASQGYLFHGTDTQWDKFDVEKIKGGMRENYGWGAYFTNKAYKCEEYGNEFVILDANSVNYPQVKGLRA